MPFPFDRTYMQLALAGGLVVGASAPLIGTFLVQRRMSLLGDGIGHVAFAGVGAGLLVGVWPVWSALVVAVVATLGMEELRRRGRAPGDVALALLFYSGIATGVVLMSLTDSLNAGVLSYLFGAILTIDRGELATIAALAAVVVGTILLAGRALFGVVVDEEWATVAGVRVRFLNATIAVLAAVTIVAAMRVVGLLLVAALMVLPVACAQLLKLSFRRTLLASAAIGACSVIVGLAAARLWGLAPGGAIVLTCAAAYAALALATRGRVTGGALDLAD
jgi:zinc transport system permease protein